MVHARQVIEADWRAAITGTLAKLGLFAAGRASEAYDCGHCCLSVQTVRAVYTPHTACVCVCV